MWDATSGKVALTLKGPTKVEEVINTVTSSPVNSATFSPDGKRVASGSADGLVRVWDVSRKKK